eukprot:CAMPEP_0176431824 /NCGR_PEP_ID=MMETSP0127-20121128/15031_1 /TAXON_ID=938130 /ORGANISM="Platyophrya macrostoma, Strain WH" /LENGTH=558 /DNA_ID=CAMNT_0017813883 /DNA_START=63 /DNA_END=1739 /DNA_ORIENTATION=-
MKFIAVTAALLVAANAISISWTGYGGDNQWTNRINWSPDQVPGTADDVTIGSGVVLVTIATGVNSLVMGTDFSAPANLTIYQQFFIGTGGLQVSGNGNLFINAGSASVTGTVTIGGNLFFQSGQISGQWTVNNRGVADLSGAAQKVLTGAQFVSQASSFIASGVIADLSGAAQKVLTGAQFVSQASSFIASRGVADLSGAAQKVLTGAQFVSQASSFIASGVIALNQSSQIIVQSALTLSGDVSIQAQDSTSVLLDTSAGTLTYTGSGVFQIQAPINVGTFNYQGGNITIFDDVAFVNPFVIPSGSYVATVGNAVANLTAGVSGAGVLSAAGSVLLLGNTTVNVLNVVGGNVSFDKVGSDVSVLTVSGGITKVNNAVSAKQLNLLSGTVQGAATVSAAQLYVSSQGFGLNAALTVSSTASVGGLISFGSAGSLTLQSTASFSTLASVTFTGVPGRTVTNNGVLNAISPVVFNNINLAGSGSANVQSTLSFQTAVLTQNSVTLSGAGVLKGANTNLSIAKVKSTPTVNAVIGSYSFTCPGECDSVSTSTTPTSAFTFSA